MVRAFRIGYAVLAWAFLVGVVAQVFLMGLFLFGGGNQARELHVSLGWALHLAPLLVLLFAVLARVGRSHWQWALALTIVVLIVPVLATMRDASPVIAGLHPVGALLTFGLAAVVAWKSLAAARMPVEQPAAASDPAADPAHP